MDIDTTGEEQYGLEAYSKLFDDIMNDLDKAVMIDKAKLVLNPSIPMFIFSIILKTDLKSKNIVDVSDVKHDTNSVHITITKEKYAPEILSALWARYGRTLVCQQTRSEIDIKDAKVDDIKNIMISSNKDDKMEIMGTIWRAIPEGIKNRFTMIDQNIITVIATEEIMTPYMLEEGKNIHASMRTK